MPAFATPLFLKRPLLLLIILGFVSCRTTAPESTQNSTQTGAAPGTTGGTLDPILELSKADEQAIYLKMLGVELEAGVKVSKDQLHSASGVIECRKDGVLESCLLRVRLMERELSGSQLLTSELGRQIWSYIASARVDLQDERLVLTNVICDYIGKKSPPYDVEDVNCAIRHPRLTNEAVFGDAVAEELAEGLRGEVAFGDQSVTLNGAVSCRIAEGSQRPTCVVRALTTGVLADKVTELSAKGAAPVARRLLQAALDQALLTAPAGSTKELTPPRELIGALVCVVDSSSLAQTGARQFLCRARL